ncbi:hypothetical protein KC921_03510 [Candidatus Woesebacteria bacterium]|nr:hypothetical protein [Candidatus Woesebacteria bacterium]
MSAKQELVTNALEQVDKSLPFRFLWTVAHLVGVEAAIESLPDDGSIAEFCQAMIAGFNIEPVSKLPEWSSNTAGPGVLVYGPHRFHLEPYILISLLQGRQIYFVAMNSARQLLPYDFRDRVLPVTPTFLGKDARKKPGLSGIVQSVKQSLFNNEDLTVHQIKQSNQQTVNRAAELLIGGNIVAIFPTASNPITTTDWYAGLGSIVDTLESNGNVDVLLQPFSIKEFRFMTFLQQMSIKFALEQFRDPIPVHVDWFPTMSIDQAVGAGDMSPRGIVDKLRTEYLWESLLLRREQKFGDNE